MTSTLFSMKPRPFSALAPLLLAAVMLLAPLAAGYAWVSGGHADESHVHRHHLLEKLIPNSYHHPVEIPTAEENSTSGRVGLDSSVVLHGVSAFALPAVMAPAFLPGLVSYFEGATAGLLTAAAATVLLTHHAMPFYIHSTRPQTQPSPLERPPTA